MVDEYLAEDKVTEAEQMSSDSSMVDEYIAVFWLSFYRFHVQIPLWSMNTRRRSNRPNRPD